MEKLVQLFLKLVLRPIVEQGLVAAIRWTRKKIDAWNRKRESKKKIKAHKGAKTKKEQEDSFSNLP